ncbi:hypothetical protein HZA43_05420 [Candidatus Peregrinibacteria bacterium]|nr:hypothetical protein [Candidatus Peregrinibacteria bacterium]
MLYCSHHQPPLEKRKPRWQWTQEGDVSQFLGELIKKLKKCETIWHFVYRIQRNAHRNTTMMVMNGGGKLTVIGR